jgi:hypothetical protein
MMKLVPGDRLRGAADSTEVIVVRPANDEVDLRCGGHPMLELNAAPPSDITIDAAYRDGTQLGKRYVHEVSGLELLCTSAGDGTLSVGMDVLALKTSKALPSSD